MERLTQSVRLFVEMQIMGRFFCKKELVEQHKAGQLHGEKEVPALFEEAFYEKKNLNPQLRET